MIPTGVSAGRGASASKTDGVGTRASKGIGVGVRPSKIVGVASCWRRFDGCARVGDAARSGGGVPAFVMSRVLAFAHEILLGSSENGEGDEDESESEFHRWY